MRELDMLGQPCPIPVVNAKRALEETNRVRVLVDNEIAVENLQKMAFQLGYRFSSEALGEKKFLAYIARTGEAKAEFPEPIAVEADGATVLIARETMGAGAEELGTLLIKGFIFALTELDPPPRAVIFLNGGARLTSEGANTVRDIAALEKKGTRIYTCGTCLNYYGIKDRLAVGEVTDMMNIARMLNDARKVISL